MTADAAENGNKDIDAAPDMQPVVRLNPIKRRGKGGGQTCCVPDCPSSSIDDGGIVYHVLSKNPATQRKWLEACRRYPPPKVTIISNNIQQNMFYSFVKITYNHIVNDQKYRHICTVLQGIRVENMRVCSLHFDDSAYERDLRNELLGLPTRKKLLSDAVPTKCLKGKYYCIDNCVQFPSLSFVLISWH